MAAKHVVFTLVENDERELELRATPPNVVVDLGAGDPPLLKFTNLTPSRIRFGSLKSGKGYGPQTREVQRLNGRLGMLVGIQPFASVSLLLHELPPGQYRYEAAEDPASLPKSGRRRALRLTGNSDPGIIITP